MIIRFSAPHKREYLSIQTLTGNRTGHFILFIEGDEEPFALMVGELVNGKIEGFCEVFDQEKGKVFEGTWIEGKRCGTCIEYEFGNVSFQGAYRNDKRNGYGWEYHNNELQREGIWKDGVYQTTYYITKQINFVSTGLGMTVIRQNGDLIVVSSPWEDNKANGKAYAYNMTTNKVVHSLLYIHGDAIEDVEDVPISSGTGTVTFANGLVWEGSIADGQANGKGILKSGSSVVYEGSMFKNMRYGIGKSFYANGNVEYEGMWSYDSRMGDGKYYDENGNIINSGVFIDNVYAFPNLILNTNEEFLLTHVLLRVIHIGDNLLNDIVEINFNDYSLLEELTIGENSLKELSELSLKELLCLRSVEIGRNSLTQCITFLNPANLPSDKKDLVGRTISNNEQRIRAEMKSFTISHCGSLESIILRQGACSDFYSCIIEGFLLSLS